jgi:hypothetical protein
MSNESSEKKCIAVHLPVGLLNEINNYKSKSGKSQTGVVIDLLEKGLGITQSTHDENENKIFFYVKVRIDISKMAELGQKLQSGELDTSLIIMTYCDKNDPAVGMSFWQANDKKSFDNVFSKFKEYYKEVIELIQVVTPMQSIKLISEMMKK